MKILVTGGTGTVGSNVVRELTGRGATVQVLTRNAAKAANLPKGVTAVEGNLLEPATVRRVFNDLDGVFLLNAVSPTEAQEGLLAVTGMRGAGVKRVVYLSVHHVTAAAWLPHFGAKVGIEEAIRQSGIPFTILRPNHFYQNDYWSKDMLLGAGIYPQPIGDVGCSRVDVRDIAEVAAIALTSEDLDGETIDVIGPDVHTGSSTAKIWTEFLGRTIVYGGNDLDAWERQSLQYMPDWLVYDVRMMFAYFQQNGLQGSRRDVERLTDLLGHEPRSLTQFARETATAWLGGAAPTTR